MFDVKCSAKGQVYAGGSERKVDAQVTVVGYLERKGERSIVIDNIPLQTNKPLFGHLEQSFVVVVVMGLLFFHIKVQRQ